MARIFISYAREDARIAQALFVQLKVDLGHEPRMDKPPKPYKQLGIGVGEKWYSQVEGEIEAADAALFLVSRNSISKTGIVQKELRLLLDKAATRPGDAIFLIPLVIDGTKDAEIPSTRVSGMQLKDLDIYRIIDDRLDEIVPTLNRLQAQLNASSSAAIDVTIPAATSALVFPLSGVSPLAGVRPIQTDDGWHGRGTLSVLWSQYVGRQRRSYGPMLVDDRIIIASCGREFGKVDDRTGIYALDPLDGSQVWFSQTQGDPGGVAIIQGRVFAGTRNGQIVCADPGSGRIIWQKQANQPVDVAPRLWQPAGCDPQLVVVERGGRFILLDPMNGAVRRVDGLGRKLWHSPIPTRDGRLVLFSQEGELLALEMRDGAARVSDRVEFLYDNPYEDGPAHCSFEAEPLVVGDIAYVPFARPTYFDAIPLIAVDLALHKPIWREPRPNARTIWSYQAPAGTDRQSFGNLRHRPVPVDDSLLVIPAYSDGAFLVSSKTGEVTKVVTLVGSFRSQLASPAPWQEHRVLAPRADGYVYDIDVANTRWLRRIDCSRAATLAEAQDYAVAMESLPDGMKARIAPELSSGFVGDMLVLPDGFIIATHEGVVPRMRFN
jgi:hypothetical protein